MERAVIRAIRMPSAMAPTAMPISRVVVLSMSVCAPVSTVLRVSDCEATDALTRSANSSASFTMVTKASVWESWTAATTRLKLSRYRPAVCTASSAMRLCAGSVRRAARAVAVLMKPSMRVRTSSSAFAVGSVRKRWALRRARIRASRACPA